jgi:hypothetical protein
VSSSFLFFLLFSSFFLFFLVWTQLRSDDCSVFKQLFPHIKPYHAARFRATDEFNFLGSALATQPYSNATYADINYQAFVTSNYTSLQSWTQLFGPYPIHGDNFTSLVQENFSDPVQTIDQDGYIVTGYLNRSTGFTQPFAAENIVMVYDSICASACAHFSEMMQVQANVSSIVFGGRPQYGPMQAVGGVRGFYKIAFADIQTLSSNVQDIAKQFNLSVPEGLRLPSTTNSPLRAALATVNSGNIIRLGDETNTPSEFTYDAADCRLFWTAQNLLDVTTIWTKAADYRWGNGECVQGSSVSATTSWHLMSVGSVVRGNPTSGIIMFLLGVMFNLCVFC